MTGRRTTARRITAVRTTACGLIAAALLTTSACGLFGSGSSKSSAGGKGSGPAATTSSSPQATPQSVAQAFLTAWSGGDYAGAAALTDDAKDATTRLGAVMGALAPKKLTLALGDQENVPAAGGSTGTTPSATSSSSGAASSPASPSGSAVAATARYGFTVTADFGNNLVWTYKSAVDLVQGPDGTPLVHWASTVVNPQLTGAQLLKAVPPPQSVVGADGNPIDTTRHPTLGLGGQGAVHPRPGEHHADAADRGVRRRQHRQPDPAVEVLGAQRPPGRRRRRRRPSRRRSTRRCSRRSRAR